MPRSASGALQLLNGEADVGTIFDAAVGLKKQGPLLSWATGRTHLEESTMPAPQRLLIPCACCCLLILAGQTARADFLGVAEVVRTDLTICQDTTQDFIDQPLNVCNFIAAFDVPTDRLLAF